MSCPGWPWTHDCPTDHANLPWMIGVGLELCAPQESFLPKASYPSFLAKTSKCIFDGRRGEGTPSVAENTLDANVD